MLIKGCPFHQQVERVSWERICPADPGSWERQEEHAALGALAQELGNSLLKQFSSPKQISYVFNTGKKD